MSNCLPPPRSHERPQFLRRAERRNVYKVAVAYAVVAALLIQAASILFATYEAPAVGDEGVVALVALWFPKVLLIAWAFETTPEEMKRTEDVSRTKSRSGTGGSSRR